MFLETDDVGVRGVEDAADGAVGEVCPWFEGEDGAQGVDVPGEDAHGGGGEG